MPLPCCFAKNLWAPLPSGMTRRECRKHNIPISTLDYWRSAHKRKSSLVEVAVEAPQPAPRR